jgi:KDO2-lipid IV(A) lauroyltransferase
MPKPKGSCKLRLEHALFAGALSLARVSPPWALALERRALVALLKRGSRRHARRVAANLALSFPGAAPAWRRDLQGRIYDHFGAVFLELARACGRGGARAVLERARISGMENLERALARGRGAIVFSAHFGNWEWLPLLLSDRLGRPIHSVARPMDNPLIEAKVRAFREALGSRIIYKRGSLRTILKRLAENEVVYLLIDQNAVAREAVFVDFFGRPAATVATAAQLYLKKGVPLVPAFLHYEPDAVVLEVLPEVGFSARGNDPAAVTRLTQELTRLIEAQVRRFPEQWLWFHDRWRTSPQQQGGSHENP